MHIALCTCTSSSSVELEWLFVDLSGDRISRSDPEQMHWSRSKRSIKQECIPVGCVPPAHWPYPRGGVCLGVSVQGVSAGRVSARGGLPWGCLPGGVPCDLSHNAFDVICMMSFHQLRLITSITAYIAFGHMTCDTRWDTHPSLDKMTDTCKNITFPQTSFAGGNNIITYEIRGSYLGGLKWIQKLDGVRPKNMYFTWQYSAVILFDISVNFVFQFVGNYQLYMGHIRLLIHVLIN